MARKSAFFLIVVSFLAFVIPLVAQSPNTAAVAVVVSDSTGAVVSGAKVSVTNSATGATRDVVTGADGSTTIAALPITGTYTVRVSREGFGNEERSRIDLRSGETATLKVTLRVGGDASEVTVYGTAEGVRACSSSSSSSCQ